MPDLGPCQHVLMSVKQLKAKEIFSRIYCVFLFLSNSYLIKALYAKKRKERETELSTPFFITDTLRGYIGVIEETLPFHLWLTKDLYLKSDFEITNDNVDSRAMNRIKQHLKKITIKSFMEIIFLKHLSFIR